MKMTKTEQHLYTTIKKILRSHFYNFQNVECSPNYSSNKILYLIRFFTRLGVHGKRDLTLFDVLIKDSKEVEFDIVGISIDDVKIEGEVIACSGKGIANTEVSAAYHHDPEAPVSIDDVLSEYHWTVKGYSNKGNAQTFIDLRAFFKSYYVVKNVVKVNDTINERVMVELLNHHV